MDNNPCSEEIGFRDYVATFLPQLIYFGYTLLVSRERKMGKETFRDEYVALLKEEKIVKDEDKKRKALEERKKFLSLAFVEDLEGEELYQALFKTDVDGMHIQLLGDKIMDVFTILKDDITRLSKELFKKGQEEYKRRTEEHVEFEEVLNEAKNTGLLQSRSVIKESDEFHKSCTRYGESLVSKFDRAGNKGVKLTKLTKLRDVYASYYEKYWLGLIGREIFLHDQIEDLISQFESRLGEQVSEFLEKARTYFSQMRDAEMLYFEALNDRLTRYLSLYTAKEINTLVLDPELIQILRDKEAVNNAVGTSHDIHLLVIDTTEDKLVSNITAWFKDLIQEYNKKEVLRNRTCILENINYLENQYSEFSKFYEVNIEFCKKSYNDVRQTLKANIQNFGTKLPGLDGRRRSTLTVGEGPPLASLPADLKAIASEEILDSSVGRKKHKKRVMIVLPEDRRYQESLTTVYEDSAPAFMKRQGSGSASAGSTLTSSYKEAGSVLSDGTDDLDLGDESDLVEAGQEALEEEAAHVPEVPESVEETTETEYSHTDDVTLNLEE